MDIHKILNYTLYNSQKINVTVSSVLLVILILVITRTVIWLLKRLFERETAKRNFDVGSLNAVYQLMKYVLWIFAILLSLDTIGAKITILLAGSAALLVGVGLGLQQIFQDFISGIVLLFEGTLKVGDIVEFKDGIVGKVKEIGIRTSKIETRSNFIMIVPNSKFISDIVINWSHIEKRTRFDVAVGVAYGSDVELVKKLLLDCANEHKIISKNPEPFVRFEDFGNSSLDFKLYFWTNDTFRVENIRSDLRFNINQKFRTNNIQIPFPQRDVHIIPPK
jgi:small-conductance mechanosensitive channel